MHGTHSDPSAIDPLRNYNFAAACHVEPTEDRDAGWLLSFVDLLTLLLTLFVLLLAYTRHSASTPHAGSQAETQRTASVHKPATPKATPAVSAKTAATTRPATAAVQPRASIPQRTPSAPKPHRPAATGAPTAARPPSSLAARKVTTAPRALPAPATAPPFTIPADIRKQVEVASSATRVNLIIKDNILFDAGSAQLKPAASALLQRIAGLLKRNSYRVSIEGHTDNTPIHTARFPSNWELSACRATNVTRYLIAQGVAADRLQAIGYADTRPRADNRTAAGRARNRRVSLVIHLRKPAGSRTGATVAAP